MDKFLEGLAALFIENTASFTKTCGGAVKIHLSPLPVFVLPREFFFKSLAAANAFAADLRREEAEAYISTLPKDGTRAG